MTNRTAVVYDLDGTLVRLAVDWAAAGRAVATALDDEGVATDGDLWTMVDRARSEGLTEPVERALARHEEPGARNSERLPLADGVPRDRPVGVCSLNGERAAQIALDEHELSDRVDAVVGRDTLDSQKPHPEPLLLAIDRLGVDPEDAIFVGDSASDEQTAHRAGVAFAWASEFDGLD
ncbi:HAD family hydrolase [Halococcoides cellulosivorans]|uniref:Phosphoglycolate phosphatase n=1 Tax=Halococcoides cellulosivorans TaxID=1679096 RepID=A0A2R4WYW1_9EURY|nr:HAD family hydrolase [Halococcoides cellulosivorans]AWB26716.1 phosphoglycolate phosphatase [Halococcoides cellulosivorans]